MSNNFLSEEQSFMMGDWFDTFGILNYLQTKNLIGMGILSERDDGTNEETYVLTNGIGSISIICNPYLDLTQIKLSPGVPVSVENDLSLIGKVSREKRNLRKYGMAGRA